LKSDRTRATTLNAALEFIWTKPFRDMSVRSLMASTNISRPTFYQYFSGIHGLMKTLLETLASDIFNTVNPWLHGAGDPVALVDETI
jgi:AcrR family transcriptional regulator